MIANTVMAIAWISGMFYAGVSIVVFVGVLAMSMGAVAGK